MKALCLAVLAAALLTPAAAAAGGVPLGGNRGPPPRHHHVGSHGFFPGFFPFERETVYVVEREVIREVPVEVPVAVEPPPPPRKPYAIGASYSSLPSGCMKLIDQGVDYFYCSGEWYRQVRGGSSPLYRAVAKP